MIEDVYKKWEHNKLSDSDFQGDLSGFGDFITKLYGNLKIDLIADLTPYKAYFKILKVNSFVNSILDKRPDLISVLSDWFEKEKGDIERIAKNIGALYFAISMNIPGGIGISLTFQPTV
jgi:hypothetical protein